VKYYSINRLDCLEERMGGGGVGLPVSAAGTITRNDDRIYLLIRGLANTQEKWPWLTGLDRLFCVRSGQYLNIPDVRVLGGARSERYSRYPQLIGYY
jgi:hypothetical protein